MLWTGIMLALGFLSLDLTGRVAARFARRPSASNRPVAGSLAAIAFFALAGMSASDSLRTLATPRIPEWILPYLNSGLSGAAAVAASYFVLRRQSVSFEQAMAELRTPEEEPESETQDASLKPCRWPAASRKRSRSSCRRST